jgi:hypothetical protein
MDIHAVATPEMVMLKALQQTVRVGAGGKIELIAPECPEGSDVQVIVLLSPQVRPLEPEQQHPPAVAESARQVPDAIARIQAMVRRYVPEGHSLVDELIADRRAEAERE